MIAEQSERKPSTVAENSLLIVEVCRSYHEMWKESSVKSKEMLQLYFFNLRIILDDVMLSVFVHCYLTRRCGGQTGMEKVGLISWISCWWDWRECHCFVVTLGNKVYRTCKEENQF